MGSLTSDVSQFASVRTLCAFDAPDSPVATALRSGKYFGVSPSSRPGLQDDYDLEEEHERLDEVDVSENDLTEMRA